MGFFPPPSVSPQRAGFGRRCSRLRRRAAERRSRVAERRSRPAARPPCRPRSTGRLQKPLSGFCARNRRYVPDVRPPPARLHVAMVVRNKRPPKRVCISKSLPCLFRRPAQKHHPRLTSNPDSHCLSRVYGRRSRREIRALVGAAPSAGTPPPPPPWNVPLSL